MPSIKDTLKDVKKEIAELRTNATSAANATKTLGENLKVDPNNVKLVVERFRSLKEELKANQSLLDGYNQKIAQLTGVRDALDVNTKEYADEWNALTKAINAYEKAAEKTKTTIEGLKAATSEQAQKNAVMDAALKQTKKTMELVENGAKALSSAVKNLAKKLFELTTKAMEQGEELFSLSKKYNTSAQSLQEWNKALYLATGENDLYTQSLQVMSKGLSSIPVGRGVAYSNALKEIGLSYKEIGSLKTEEQFEKIIRGLANIGNESERAAYAIQLFGDNGQSIAAIFNDSTKSLDDYLEEAREFGVLTDEQVENLHEQNQELEKLKSKFDEFFAELSETLAPLISDIIDILQDTVLPLLKDISEWFAGMDKPSQTMILIILSLIVILPGLCTALSAFGTVSQIASVGVGALGLSMTSLVPIILAVVAALLLLVAVFGSSNSKVKELQGLVDEQKKTIDQLTASGIDFKTETEQNVNQNKQATVDININATATGDTPISSETASAVAALTADELDRRWGRNIGK